MAEPTIKDVLEAISALRTEMATKRDLDEVRRDVAEIRRDVRAIDGHVATLDGHVKALDGRVAALDAKVDAGFARIDTAIAELGEDLDRHMTVHRKLEKQVEAIKPKPTRAAPRAPRRR